MLSECSLRLPLDTCRLVLCGKPCFARMILLNARILMSWKLNLERTKTVMSRQGELFLQHLTRTVKLTNLSSTFLRVPLLSSLIGQPQLAMMVKWQPRSTIGWWVKSTCTTTKTINCVWNTNLNRWITIGPPKPRQFARRVDLSMCKPSRKPSMPSTHTARTKYRNQRPLARKRKCRKHWYHPTTKTWKLSSMLRIQKYVMALKIWGSFKP